MTSVVRRVLGLHDFNVIIYILRYTIIYYTVIGYSAADLSTLWINISLYGYFIYVNNNNIAVMLIHVWSLLFCELPTYMCELHATAESRILCARSLECFLHDWNFLLGIFCTGWWALLNILCYYVQNFHFFFFHFTPMRVVYIAHRYHLIPILLLIYYVAFPIVIISTYS